MTSSVSGLRISRRTAWLTVIGWLLLIGVLTSLAPTLKSVETNDDDGPPANSMSMRAEALVADAFDEGGAPPAVVVVTGGGSDVRTAAEEIHARVTAAPDELPALVHVGDPVIGEDGAMLLVQTQGAPSEDDFKDSIAGLREVVADVADETGTEAAVTGPAGIVTDAVKVFGGSDKTLLLGTLGLVVVLLFVIYRSPVLVVVALLGVGFAMRLAEGAGALLADAGLITVSGQTASIMTVLLFGVGTDYALIIFARFREELARNPDPSVAMGRAMVGVSGALMASLSTIVAAVLALLASITPTLKAFGPYLAIGVASMAAVAFTLTPALLVIVGRFAFWPRRSPAGAGTASESRIWARVADGVIAAPRRVLAAGLAALAVLSLGLIGAQQSFDMVSGFRIDTESARGQELLADAFGPGAIASTRVVLHAEDADATITQAQAGQVAGALAEADGVAAPGGVRVSGDAQTAVLDVVLDSHPYGPGAMGRVDGLRESAVDAVEVLGMDVEVLVGGETQVAVDTRDALDRDLVVVGLLMLLAVSLILGLVLRSVLAPVYLAVTLLLSYVATMGATAFLALTLGGDAGIGNRVAVYVLVFLVALGVDYTIFMMTRYRQELARSGTLEALRTSIVRTGGVISSAGVILAGTFAVLMTQPIRELHQFGLAMAIGILLDTFVVRPLLVPAIIALLGRRALWPSRVGITDREGVRPSPDLVHAS